MKEQLRQIYADLSSGRLSQDEALDRIKAIKSPPASSAAGALLITPAWVDGGSASPTAHTYAEHHVVLCDWPAGDVETLRFSLPQSRFLALQAEPSQNIAQRYSDHATACFELVRSVLQSKPQSDVLVQIVVPSDGEQVLLAGLSALLRTAALENPRVAGQLLLVSAEMTAEELARLLEREKRDGREAIVRVDGGVRRVSRWQEVEESAEVAPIAFRDAGVYLITGGAGGVGLLLAKEILGNCNARVVLTGRSAASADRLEALSAFADRASYRRADVADLEQVTQLIASIRQDYGRLDGILHCAGILADEFILKKSADEFRRVLAPKVAGTFHLDQASRDIELDFFVLFSSFAGGMGNPGQVDYAVANGFLDQFAAYRNRLAAANARHGRTRSINWPLWQDGGMVMDAATRDALQQATGIQPMQTATGLSAFHRSLALPYDQLLVAEGDLARLRRALLIGRPLQAEPVPVVTSGVPADDLLERTQNYLRREFAELLKLPSHRIDPQAALERYGIDSLLAMKLTSQLEKTFGSLSKTLFFEYQTIEDLARYFAQSHASRLAALFAPTAAEVQVAPVAPAEPKRVAGRRVSRERLVEPTLEPVPKRESDPIAIVGLSGRYPEAVDVEAYWQNLRDGKDCITEIPQDRWEWQKYFSSDRTQSGQHFSKWGGFISDVDKFDPLFFNISPKDAKYIDPQERLFLQHAWLAIEDAGYTRAGLQTAHENDLPGQVGVYVGVMYSEYQLFGAEASLQGNRVGIAGSIASIANRVSYAFNLHGPSMTLDTMCSSSLTAIHIACQDLKQGRTSLAIAGGVNVTIHPNKYLALSAGQFISSDGHCQSFGEGGDGYIPGEGVGVVVLKRLSDAQRDGDHIYGIIRGSALNHGGKTNGYTVPNPQAQAAAISRALVESSTDPRHVSYIEAHGTGTKLGDPIEIAALGKAFRQSTQDNGFCLIGSAKSNIGHCESAAGIAGLTKVLLQMQHQQVVPSLHSAQLNPHIDFESSPFVVNQTLRTWEAPVLDGRTLPRIAGISSFGAGGSNAHMIIEEYPAPASQRTPAGPFAIVLSARTSGQLQQKAADLLNFVRSRVSAIDLESLAYTLQVGREAMDERLAFIVTSAEQLAEKLQAYVGGKESIEDAFVGDVKRNREAMMVFSGDADLLATVDQWIAAKKLAKLLDLWVKGLEIDWPRLYAGPKPMRMSLPGYPFARERYWIDVEPVVEKAPATAVLHPLLHTNTSDLTQQSYSSTFRGDEPFVSTPAAAYLEMARVAVEKAARASMDLRDVVLAQPVALPVNTPVHIALLTNGDGGIDFEIYSGEGDAEVVHGQGRAVPGVERKPDPTVEVVQPVAPRKESKVAPLAVKARTAVSLSSPRGDKAQQPAAGRAPVVLSSTRRDAAPKAQDGVFTADVAKLEQLRREPSVKVVILDGIERVSGQELLQALASFPYPVIAAAEGDAIGESFRAAALCDFFVCNEDARYGLSNPTPADLALFSERFGAARAQELLCGPARSGKELRAKGWTNPIVPAAQVRVHAQQLAAALATKSQDALRILKQHLTRNLVGLVAQLTPAETAADPAPANVAVVSTGDFQNAPEDAKALVLAIEDVTNDAFPELQRRILESEVPVVAALNGNATGNAFLAAQFCDAAVYSRDGVYSAANVDAAKAAAFAHRFGTEAASEVLLTGSDRSGRELQQRVASLNVVDADQVLSTATAIATQFAALPRTTFTASRKRLQEALRNRPATSQQPDEIHARLSSAPVSIPLQSAVVSVVAHPDGVVVVKLEDREAKNMFSDAFMKGVTEAFAHVAQTPWYKVVVLTGFDQYFASGGTKESLLAVQQGKAKFTDFNVHQALQCELPVIAAMQGHGIGAGWPLGMFADIVLLSEESRYVSPYMNYGFTPGAGATFILGEKIGTDLARESLLTAQPYGGRELKERGVALRVLPRSEVVPTAMALASRIAESSRGRLVALKQQLAATVREQLDEIYRLELAMHEQTFVGRADTLERIESAFAPEVKAAEPAPQQPRVAKPVLSTGSGDVTATLRKLLANELQMREGDIDEHAKFVDLGLESIGGVTWVRKINEKYQTSIDPTKVYSYPTLAEFSRFVREEAEKQGTATSEVAAPVVEAPAPVVETPAPVISTPQPAFTVTAEKLTSWRKRAVTRFTVIAPAPAPAPAPQPAPEAIAIIGMAGQFPQAKNLDEFWRNIAEGRNCITPVAPKRWDVNAFYQPGEAVAGKTNSQWFGALDEYDLFDPLFFSISPREAESMDPQQRLFLQACWHGIENAGYDARALSGSKCGVFVGCAYGDYHLLSRDQQLSAQGFTGDATSILAGRVSYVLNLQGPCLSIDTACSSSLVAIAHACDSLVSGASDLALAGGVYVMAGPEMHIKSSQVGMLSPDGKCFTFDQRANGFVPGEGVGVVLLKRLSDAERDGDIIRAVIHGWAVNQDGKTNGITAPNTESQTRLEQEVYDRYKIDPANIQLVEAHGTGTKLGDPIEVEGLKKAFAKYTDRKDYCALGSVKSNIGHCLTAAGVAGVTKLVLALQNRQLPPTIHFERLNEHIDLTNSPFYVNDRLQNWDVAEKRQRLAAISAFGFSGTNAHMVVGEYVPPIGKTKPAVSVITQNGKVIVPLSARTASQLRQKAVDLLGFIRNTPSVDLIELSYTLQVGREPMDERLAVLVSSVEELAQKLEAWINGASDIDDLQQAHIKRSRESIAILTQDDEMRDTVVEKCLAGRKLARLMELWVKGLEVDWTRLYGDAKPRRVVLPVYPFAKDRYWIDVTPVVAAPAPVAAPAVLHPLLHSNVSDLSAQRYRSTFTAGEFSNALCLDMARAAVEHALPERPEGAVVELQDIEWSAPVVVADAIEVTITLVAGEDDQIDFEIATATQTLCQGRAVLAEAKAPAAPRTEVALPPVVTALPVVPVERKKPAITLAAPGAIAAPAAIARPTVSLATPAAPAVESRDRANGILEIAVDATNLRQTLDRAQQDPSLKVLVLKGIERVEAIEPLGSFPYPVIGVVERDAIGAGFLAAALCDFMVCSEEATYGLTNPAPAAARLLSERFGDAFAQDFLSNATSTGSELRAKGWTCPIVPKAQLDATAQKLATSLATKSHESLRLLKQHLSRGIAALVSELTRADVPVHDATGEVIALRAFETMLPTAEAKAIVLILDTDVAEDQLRRFIADSQVPVIAALPAGAGGNAFLIAQLCDAAVYDRQSTYSAADLRTTPEAAALFLHRFGTTLGSELLLSGAGFTGAELQRRSGTVIVAGDVLATATVVAESWSKLPRATVTAMRKQAADRIASIPAPVASDEIPELPPTEPTPVPLRSKAVTATAHPEGILVVKMEDREAKNMFSDAFVEGVKEAFAHVAEMPAYKVVVLTGFDSYFASGGTKEGLVAIQQGKAKFTDFDIHQVALDCKLPVIAAMQGHGIGAGWCVGMFGDLVLLSDESRYVSPYMDYGFTPGAGATFILADRIGRDLARESLLTAQPFTGAELRERGLRLPILPRNEVVAAAMALARQIARAPRARLIALKQLLTAHVRQALPETYRFEVAMHEKTFVGQSGTLSRIQTKFQEENRPAEVVEAPMTPAADGDVLRSVTATLRGLLAKELHLRDSDIEEDVEFVELGLDSISAVTWIRNVNEKYKTSIEATKVYRYPNLAQLSVFVKEEAEKHGVLPAVAADERRARLQPAPLVGGRAEAAAPAPARPLTSKLTGRRRTSSTSTAPAPAPQKREAIAVIGMSGRFPQAQNLEEYWQNLAQGRNSITEVPPSRWDLNRYDRARWLGVVDDVDRFDPLFFRIAPQEAEYIDPQHRLFLQESYRAFEDAGYAAGTLSDRNCGVYLGISNNDYAMLLLKSGIQSTPVTSNSFAIAAARIAYYLNLKGPAISVDTACSSSLVAIHLACQALLSGETDMALAGGVTLWLTPESHLSMSEAGMLSATGQCRTFDDAADGIVVSEGVGAVVLKRLSDAEADGDFIHGVILGSGTNQDGRTNGITAPSVNAQITLERSIYRKFDIDPATISYVEAHGTGTKLGDPIELEALAAAFGEKTDKKNYCGLGSVKSNIGHTASAAGVASVLKVLLSLRHRTLVPTLNVTRENSHFDFKNSPFYVCRELEAWEPVPGSRRRAAVSSFGYSGTNSHLVIEEYVPQTERAAPSGSGPVIVPLSARTADQLQQKARDLAHFLRTTTMPVDLHSVAYTLQLGRDAMDERASFVVTSIDALIDKLSAFADGEKIVEDAWAGRVESGSDGMALIGRDDDIQEAVEKWIARGKYAKLAELWSRGLNVDWNKLHGSVKPQRIGLPAYPFARDRFWIDTVVPAPIPDEPIADLDALGDIDDILGKIDGGAMETDHALRLLKTLV